MERIKIAFTRAYYRVYYWCSRLLVLAAGRALLRLAPRVVGLSLSNCVRDVAAGKVPYDKVERIIASTVAGDAATWQEVLSSYRNRFWMEFPEKAVAIAGRFMEEGKIYQPWLRGKPCPNIARGHWRVRFLFWRVQV